MQYLLSYMYLDTNQLQWLGDSVHLQAMVPQVYGIPNPV